MTGPVERLHPAARSFDRVAEMYERSRPGYPKAAVRWLDTVLGLGPRRTVVELGSGTGKLTRMLRLSGAAIVAVEPMPGMRAVFERVVPGVVVVPGTAESIPVPDGFADAVVAAQAFHWFRGRSALREIARVLRPGGGLGLLWNTRLPSSATLRRVAEIVARYRQGAPRSSGAAWKAPFGRVDSPFLRLRERTFRHVQYASRARFVERFLSVSVIAALPPSEQAAVAQELRAAMDDVPATGGRGTIALPYRTEVYWTRRKR